MAESQANAEPAATRGLSRLGAALTGGGAVLLWIFSRAVWVTAQYSDSLAGGGTAEVTGSEWSAETMAVALLLVVGTIGMLTLRRMGRRIVGGVSALAALGAGVSPALFLVNGPDAERVHTILTAGADASQPGASPGAIAEWAELTSVSAHTAAPALALVGCALAAVGGAMAALRPGTDAPKLSKYEKDSVRREHIREDLDARPDSGRVLWDALDADIDPTDEAGDFNAAGRAR